MSFSTLLYLVFHLFLDLNNLFVEYKCLFQTITSLFSSKPKPEPEPKPPEPPKPVEINLDRIPGLDDDFFDESKKPAMPATGSARMGAAGARPGAQPAQPEQPSGLLGGLTSGLTSGLSGLTGGATAGVTGTLGNIGGSAAGAAGGVLNAGKGLFKKFGF